MSMRSPLGYMVPEETARVARAAFPKGNLYMAREPHWNRKWRYGKISQC